jgi:putative ABC transport system permease protein
MVGNAWRDVVYSAKSLLGAKARTVLTSLGIIIGVASVLAVASVGESAQGLITGQITSMGTNLIGVIPGGTNEDEGPPVSAYGIVTTTLKDTDVEEALRDVPHLEAGSPYVSATDVVSYHDEAAVTTVYGVSEQLPFVEDMGVARGRFLSQADVAGYARTAVLGHTVAGKLFGSADPLGKFIRLNNSNYEVIGVAEERGTAAFQDQDDLVYIPYTTAQKLVAGIDYISFARFKVDAAENVMGAKSDLERLLRRRHHIKDATKDDFTIRTTVQALDVIGSVTDVLKMFVLAVTAISLLVGGINIMNIMFVSVRERTREIGLRKALGARPSRILLQFVTESVLISVLGGLVGMLFGVLLTFIAAVAVRAYGYDWDFLVPPLAVAQSIGISVTIGIVFGISPARKAARLEPISALRYE